MNIFDYYKMINSSLFLKQLISGLTNEFCLNLDICYFPKPFACMYLKSILVAFFKPLAEACLLISTLDRLNRLSRVNYMTFKSTARVTR